jgi:aminoglycoside phosphotransferase family enzyme/predicted kinase
MHPAPWPGHSVEQRGGLVTALSSGATRDHGSQLAEPAAVVETHSSYVFFVGDRAYKLKKPLDLGFLDFRDRAARKRACQDEVELNRRLAPDVYLGVADVLGVDGRLADHLVVMRRMPADRRLATLVAAGTDVAVDLRRLARLLADFHAGCKSSPAIAEYGSRDALAGLWREGFAALAAFTGRLLSLEDIAGCQLLAERYLAGREALFAERIAAGRVRDGHGDLLAEDIFCLPDGPRVLDCLEFADRFRYGDVLGDVAFLAMDLERLGAPALARQLFTDYREFSAETHPRSLEDHYVAYRAFVRSKVSCVRADQGAPSAAEEARRLATLCRAHLERTRVRLVLVGGLPGTGKSTVAAGIADAHGWALVSSDVLRKSLAGLAPDTPAPAAYAEGMYSPARTAETYDALLARAATALARGESVVLDASWTDRRWRAAAAAVAADTASDLVVLRCQAPDRLADERIRRRAAGPSHSDATAEIRGRMAAADAGWDDAVPVPTDRAWPEPLSIALAAVSGNRGGTQTGAPKR